VLRNIGIELIEEPPSEGGGLAAWPGIQTSAEEEQT